MEKVLQKKNSKFNNISHYNALWLYQGKKWMSWYFPWHFSNFGKLFFLIFSMRKIVSWHAIYLCPGITRTAQIAFPWTLRTPGKDNTLSAYHLYGQSGENSNGRVHPGEMFSEKRCYLPEWNGTTEIFCTIWLDYQCQDSSKEKTKNMPVFFKW